MTTTWSSCRSPVSLPIGRHHMSLHRLLRLSLCTSTSPRAVEALTYCPVLTPGKLPTFHTWSSVLQTHHGPHCPSAIHSCGPWGTADMLTQATSLAHSKGHMYFLWSVCPAHTLHKCSSGWRTQERHSVSHITTALNSLSKVTSF